MPSTRPAHKRHRNLHDSLVDMTKMQLARQQLLALQDDLFGIEETAEEMSQIMDHVSALRDILNGSARKMKLDFASVTRQDLSNLGIKMKFLVIDKTVLAERCAAHDPTHIDSLCGQITRIHRFVSMRGPGAKMILDAILLAVAELSVDAMSVAIFPDMRIASTSGDGIQITNPETNFRLWLTGNADYAICRYVDYAEGRHWALHASIGCVMVNTRNWIVLVESKEQDKDLYDSLPKAISQAVAFSEVTGSKTVRFCLSDGWQWIFSLLTQDEHGRRVCYQGETFSIIKPRPNAEASLRQDVSEIVALLHHWIVARGDPMHDPLYTLKAVEDF